MNEKSKKKNRLGFKCNRPRADLEKVFLEPIDAFYSDVLLMVYVGR